MDADLADYFGSIPHTELMTSVARRIVDRRVLHADQRVAGLPRGRDRHTRTDDTDKAEARDQRRGIPQGSPLSPLLANLYMRRFVLGWKKLGLEHSLGSRIVTYADDLVILCKKGKAEEALHRLREIMGQLKLTVNEEKTRICKVPERRVRLPGVHVRADVFGENRPGPPGATAAKKSIQRAVEKIHALTARAGTWQETTVLVGS